ncbi:MAG TPA: riboflavin synthase [Fimbriiglobus sp.]|jgi:riboflavin synthase
MFTGLVRGIGTVSAAIDDGCGGRILRVNAPNVSPQAVGASVAVDGVCLTVSESSAESLTFQAGPETIDRTTLGKLAAGNRVNLEHALRVGDPLGGHFVTGHVDCVGSIAEIVESGEWQTYYFNVPKGFDELLVMKGSVAVDGISLTLAEVTPDRFGVMLIPHTLANTALGTKGVGDAVNLEFDIIAKHVRKLVKNLTVTI